MKAWRFYSFGDMRLDDIPSPKVKPGWLVCKVRRVQPSITDAQRAMGVATMGAEKMREIIEKQAPVQLLGHEMSAEVIEVGDGVEGFQVGDIVCTTGHASCGTCYWCATGRDSWCKKKLHVGITTPGAFAEEILIPVSAVVKVSPKLDDASIVCLQPLSTTVAAIRDAKLSPGQTIAITGQGVMGLYMLQAVRMFGAKAVFVTDIRDEALELSKKFHADEIINSKKDDPVEKIMDLTNGEGVDTVFECAGGNLSDGLAGDKTLKDAFKFAKHGGSIVQVAALVGDAKIDTSILRDKGLKWIFTEGHGKQTLDIGASWVTSGRVDVKSIITHETKGLENLPLAFEITRNKEKFKATNPCQVVLED